MIIINKKLGANRKLKLHTDMSQKLHVDSRNKELFLSISLLKIIQHIFLDIKGGKYFASNNTKSICVIFYYVGKYQP